MAKQPKDDGGPAFPQSVFHDETPEADSFVESKGGMSLRDYFAGQAMIGFLASASPKADTDAELADYAYQIADAMLKERAK